MALEKFTSSPLPSPPKDYDAGYIRQLIRVIEIFFSQLNSSTPNYAQSYRATTFYGGYYNGAAQNVTTAEKVALTAVAGQVVFDTTLGKLCVYTGAAWQTITSV